MNKVITPEQMAAEVLALMEKHGIVDALKQASPEERDAIVKFLMNTFDARMP